MYCTSGGCSTSDSANRALFPPREPVHSQHLLAVSADAGARRTIGSPRQASNHSTQPLWTQVDQGTSSTPPRRWHWHLKHFRLPAETSHGVHQPPSEPQAVIQGVCTRRPQALLLGRLLDNPPPPSHPPPRPVCVCCLCAERGRSSCPRRCSPACRAGGGGCGNAAAGRQEGGVGGGAPRGAHFRAAGDSGEAAGSGRAEWTMHFRQPVAAQR